MQGNDLRSRAIPEAIQEAAGKVDLATPGPKSVRENSRRPSGVCVVAFLSPLRGLLFHHLVPTGCAVGCIPTPLRGFMEHCSSTFRAPIKHRLLRDLLDLSTFPGFRSAGLLADVAPGGILQRYCGAYLGDHRYAFMGLRK